MSLGMAVYTLYIYIYIYVGSRQARWELPVPIKQHDFTAFHKVQARPPIWGSMSCLVTAKRLPTRWRAMAESYVPSGLSTELHTFHETHMVESLLHCLGVCCRPMRG